jgi:hypothetical protein
LIGKPKCLLPVTLAKYVLLNLQFFIDKKLIFKRL